MDIINLRNSVMIMPQSTFYKIWTILMIITLTYNLLYIPYSISFGYEALTGDLFGVDVLSLVIYFLDIIVQANTARPQG
jgi:hypothetical protein